MANSIDNSCLIFKRLIRVYCVERYMVARRHGQGGTCPPLRKCCKVLCLISSYSEDLCFERWRLKKVVNFFEEKCFPGFPLEKILRAPMVPRPLSQNSIVRATCSYAVTYSCYRQLLLCSASAEDALRAGITKLRCPRSSVCLSGCESVF